MDIKQLILGIGNYLMGDEGVGVHVIHELLKSGLPDKVEIIDGGTGGFHLLSYLQDYPEVILIDATMDGNPPGTVNLIQPRFSGDFPRALSAHDIGLKDLVESAEILGKLPRIELITISIEEIQYMKTSLSDEVAAAVPNVVEVVRELVLVKLKAGSEATN